MNTFHDETDRSSVAAYASVSLSNRQGFDVIVVLHADREGATFSIPLLPLLHHRGDRCSRKDLFLIPFSTAATARGWIRFGSVWLVGCWAETQQHSSDVLVVRDAAAAAAVGERTSAKGYIKFASQACSGGIERDSTT